MVRLVSRFPAPEQRHPERLRSPLRWRFSRVGADRVSVGRLGALVWPRGRHGSEAVDVDRGQLVGRHLNRFAVVMSLDELVPVGRWTPGGCNRWGLERFAQMREDFPDRPRLRNERDQPDVAAARWALERELLTHPGHEFRPRDSRRVVGAGLVMRVAAVSGAVTVVSMSAGRDLALLTDVCDRECRDGFSQPVIRGEHTVVAMPVLPRRRHELGEPVEELKRREFDDAIGPRPRGLAAAAGPDPRGGFVPGQQVADFGDPAVCTADHGESFERERRALALPQQVFQTLKIAGHVAVEERDPDARVD